MHAAAARILIAAAVLALAGCAGWRPPSITEGAPDQSTNAQAPPAVFGDEPRYDNFPDSGR